MSPGCSNDLMLLLQGLMDRDAWALTVLDAFGKPDSGMLQGRIWFPGGFDECQDVDAIVYNNATEATDQFKGKYCRLDIPTGRPSFVPGVENSIRVGICVSDRCNVADLNNLIETVQRTFLNGTTNADITAVCDEPLRLGSDAIGCICFLAVLGAFILFGTLYDILAVQMKVKTKDNSSEIQHRLTVVSGISYVNNAFAGKENGNVPHDQEKELPPVYTMKADNHVNTDTPIIEPVSNQQSQGTMERILLAFSVYSNGDPEHRPERGSLGALNGIRFLSMAWVILGHTFSFPIGLSANILKFAFDQESYVSFCAIMYATVSVDSFFTLSGVLVAYLTLRELKKVGGANRLNWLMFYFHRFWRLTPPYMLVLMFGTVLSPYLINGPLRLTHDLPSMGECRHTWWTNLLYINNYVELDHMCMGWSWYLANDMQFYIISPLILLPLFYNVVAGAISCLVFLSASLAARWVIAYQHEYPVQGMLPDAPQPIDGNSWKMQYAPSYSRLGPYISLNLLLWFLSLATFCLVVYGPYSRDGNHIFSLGESSAYTALSRTAWGVALAYLIIACCTGHGVAVVAGFIPLSRLTYCAYLIHPLVMITFYSSRRQLTYFTHFELIYLFLGHMTLTYGLSFIVSLVFEAPMMGLEKAVLRKGMLDAFGKPDSGIMQGRIWFPGGYDECLGVDATVNNNAMETMNHFKGKYCRLELPSDIPPLGLGYENAIRIGLCVSDRCNKADLNSFVEAVQKTLLNITTKGKIEVVCDEPMQLGSDAIGCICFLASLGAFVLFGTLYDILAVQMKSNYNDKSCKTPHRVTVASGVFNVNKAAIRVESHTDAHDIKEEIPPVLIEKAVNCSNTGNPNVEKVLSKHNQGAMERVLLAFSFYSNGVKILNTDQRKGSLNALNGIRFLSMAWVILGHTYGFSIGFDANMLTFASGQKSFASFCAIIGVLVAYLTLQELKKVGGAKRLNWLMFYFHRFWRLTPPYMLVLMFGTVLSPYLISGPLRIPGDLPTMLECRKNWWTNLLYVNNYVENDHMCMGWSCHLANDMQFYIISPLILLPLFYNLVAGVVSCIVFLSFTTAARWVITFLQEYPVQNYLSNVPPPKDENYGRNLYIPSYSRLGPYIVGLFVGYLLYKTKSKLKIPKSLNLVLWFVSFSTFCLVVYGPYSQDGNHIFSVNESSAYFALARTAWGVALAYLIVASCTGHGGWINEMLSWRGFIPLSRLTYCAYLIHPLVMSTFYMNRRQLTYFTQFELIYLFLGHMTMTYGLSFIVSLVFEAPMMGLEKAILRMGGK
ncbi:LOW QUALITY PROTEIN: NRF6-like protein [Mya arenaria]|uniref:NRF6-like protein n=2 Tax=Mya arenaria TaxID=6604 RepID=A0ABY7ECF1_MYAAR|nr:LOW QUALITY PROTEIN: NRF6-like protein [Mya arenaria]